MKRRKREYQIHKTLILKTTRMKNNMKKIISSPYFLPVRLFFQCFQRISGQQVKYLNCDNAFIEKLLRYRHSGLTLCLFASRLLAGDFPNANHNGHCIL